MCQKNEMLVFKGWIYFIRSWISQLEHEFQLVVRALMNVIALSFKFEPKTESLKKSKSLDILKFKKKIKKYCGKHVTK